MTSMKKLIYILLLAAAMMACSKTEVAYNDAETGEISISPVAGNITKAAVTDGVYPTTNRLALFAFHAPYHKATVNMGDEGEVVTPETPVTVDYARFTEKYLYNTQYYFNNTSKEWIGSGASYYWPITGSLVFAGYSLPAGGQLDIAAGTAAVPNPSFDLQSDVLEIKGYTQSSDRDETFDLMYFGRTDGSYNNRRNGVAVPLVFSHALAWITVEVKGGNGTSGWIITDVQFKGVNTKADFKYDGLAVAPAPKVTWALDAQDTKADMDIFDPEAGQPGQPLTGSFLPIATVKGGTVVIPQTVKGLEITVKYDSPAGDEITEVIPVPLSSDASVKWEAGKHYTYQLTFSPVEIKVAPSVGEWGNEGPTDIAVNPIN